MNAWKHSGVTTGTIELKCTGESITIAVCDNGKGFNYSDIECKETIGLKSLKYRAGELNGELVVETAPNKGCKLILTIPVLDSSSFF
jgi:two-component system NarL family sensor kinase